MASYGGFSAEGAAALGQQLISHRHRNFLAATNPRHFPTFPLSTQLKAQPDSSWVCGIVLCAAFVAEENRTGSPWYYRLAQTIYRLPKTWLFIVYGIIVAHCCLPNLNPFYRFVYELAYKFKNAPLQQKVFRTQISGFSLCMTIIPFGGMCCINVGKLPHAPQEVRLKGISMHQKFYRFFVIKISIVIMEIKLIETLA